MMHNHVHTVLVTVQMNIVILVKLLKYGGSTWSLVNGTLVCCIAHNAVGCTNVLLYVINSNSNVSRFKQT